MIGWYMDKWSRVVSTLWIGAFDSYLQYQYSFEHVASFADYKNITNVFHISVKSQVTLSS
jgi:hypothetical protein